MSAYEGYLSFGGNEIVNNTRTRGIAESAQPCPMYWLRGDVCEAIPVALFDQSGYSWEAISDVPWADPSIPESKNFFGLFATSIGEVYDSTRSVQRTGRVGDGDVLGRTRKSNKTMRVKGLLIGRGRAAIEYGQTWLAGAVDPNTCGQHGSQCGLTDLTWFVDCPPTPGTVSVPGAPPTTRPQTDAEYRATVAKGVRYLHDVACISGPIITDTLNSGDFWAYEVELIFGAERPWVYGETTPVALSPTLPVVIQDVPYNLAPYPSAEIASGDALVARNLSANPSVEVNATGWVGAIAAVSGSDPVPLFTVGRSTELAAAGGASYRGRLLATAGKTGVGTGFLFQRVSGLTSGGRISAGLWAAAVVLGSGSVGSVIVELVWYTSADVYINEQVVGSGSGTDLSGKAYSAKSVIVPATATKVEVRARFVNVSFTPTSDIRLYVDALSVTTP